MQAKQRETLDKIIRHWDDPSVELSGEDQVNLIGLQNWIDHLIDYAYDRGEPVVFLSDSEPDRTEVQDA